jgi:hypothetical protein
MLYGSYQSIIGKQNPTTLATFEYKTRLFNADSPYVFRHKLAPNQGVLCNNVSSAYFSDS